MVLHRKYVFPILVVLLLSGWFVYILQSEKSFAEIYAFAWPMALTMVVGSFVAGATAEGGGAIAFPVMTLLLNIAPTEARIFSLGCQCFGMTSASATIISRNIPFVVKAILPVSISGIAGFIVSDLFLVDRIPGTLTKLFFVSLWISFGIALWSINRKNQNIKRKNLPEFVSQKSILFLSIAGLIGGMVSAVFGNGIDIITFTLLTLYFRIDEKVATPTSVILMTIMTVFGFLWHVFVRKDVSSDIEMYLLGAIPVCITTGSIGAYAVSKMKNAIIVNFLYLVIAAQFVTAVYVIQPDFLHWVFCLIVIAVGILFFGSMAKNSPFKNQKKQTFENIT